MSLKKSTTPLAERMVGATTVTPNDITPNAIPLHGAPAADSPAVIPPVLSLSL